ncbi:MAG: aminoacyl-tRNA deacylase [Candidatus Aminicenantes bacterium RBG_13_64_14]|nr:MAG: aminoacyl-tRNA deacylase [Candidatus Aminicenantes bacterium RBG_13_64_14]
MSRDKAPMTPAVRALRQAGVSFTEHPYKYVEHGGTASFAREFGVDEHTVIKTLIMEDDAKKPLVVLMHGDREVLTKELARVLSVKTVQPCTPETAERHSGYMVGGTSPFGLRKPIPVYVEETILALPRIFINGGKRGFLVGLDPKDLVSVLKPTAVRVAVPKP